MSVRWTMRVFTISLIASLLPQPTVAQLATPSPADVQAGGLLLQMSEGHTTATLLNIDVSTALAPALLLLLTMNDRRRRHATHS